MPQSIYGFKTVFSVGHEGVGVGVPPAGVGVGVGVPPVGVGVGVLPDGVGVGVGVPGPGVGVGVDEPHEKQPENLINVPSLPSTISDLLEQETSLDWGTSKHFEGS